MSRREGAEMAVVLSGGGARAAYQVGFLRCLARDFPDYSIPIVTGVSAGAINAAHLANFPAPLPEAVDDLTKLWAELTFDRVFRTDPATLWSNVMRWSRQLLSGGRGARQVRSLLDTQPLRELLIEELTPNARGEIEGIQRKIDAGHLDAVALTTINYGTGQTITWTQGRNIEAWERPNRCSAEVPLTVDHVMASAALPILFPAQNLGAGWYGDGGVRLAAPLAPAIHLGATRLIAISTRYRRTRDEADRPVTIGYPPLAQVAGVLLNAIFLDAIDQDALRARRLNELLERLPVSERGALRPIELLVLRPSQDLGRLAGDYEAALPKAFRFLTRGLGTRETMSPDVLAMLMFHPQYLQRLIEIGEADANAQKDRIRAMLEVPLP